VKTEGIEEEDSLAENVMRQALHPLDQFRAFNSLHEQGVTIDEIAARFFVTSQVVRQRLKLAAASPKLLDLYVAEELTLDQLSAFCVNGDHARQEEVWESLSRSYNKEPYLIRRMLTEGAVRASDKRAIFVGTEAYEAAGGVVLRDLFASDQGGWLQDAALLDRLARKKLAEAAEALRGEGWKWSEVSIDFPYGHTHGLRRLPANYPPLLPEEQARYEVALAEYNSLSEQYEGDGDLPEDVDQRLAELEQAIAAVKERPAIYDPADIARAGILVSIDHGGALKVERGFLRFEDGMPAAHEESGDDSASSNIQQILRSDAAHEVGQADSPLSSTASSSVLSDDEADFSPRLSDRLLTELTAYRTLALRDALAKNPEAAFLAAIHALALKAFYGGGFDACVEIDSESVFLGSHAPGLGDTPAAWALDEAHGNWQLRLPEKPQNLWAWLVTLDPDARASLFAHCVGLSVNALYLAYDKRPRALTHADLMAEHLTLDMTAYWKPTADSYFRKVTKAQIMAAVREAKGEAIAGMIEHLKKADMAAEAERLLEGTAWLPEILRATNLEALVQPQADESTSEPPPVVDDDDLPAFFAEVGGGPSHPAAAG